MVEGGEVRRQAGRERLAAPADAAPSQLHRAHAPAHCALRGPSWLIYDVTPARSTGAPALTAVEWSLVDGALAFGDLQRAGEQVDTTLLVRFNGQDALCGRDGRRGRGRFRRCGRPAHQRADYHAARGGQWRAE